MNDSKYIIFIIFDTAFGYCDAPVIFPNFITHSEMARKVGKEVTSAGFVSIGKNRDSTVDVEAYGESVSLDKKSRPEDSQILKKALNLVAN